jgi:hypothetical protein
MGAAGPIGQHAVSLDERQAAAVSAALHRRIGSPGGPFTLTAKAWYAAGVV